MRDVAYKDYNNYYEIDECGNVWSKERIVYRDDGVVQRRSPRKLSWCKNCDGYPTVKLTVDGVSERIAVHRLVALTFVPNPNKLPEVNHIDLNRRNPRADNLEWSSHRENVNYSHILGRYAKPQFCDENNPRAKPVELIDLGLRFKCIKHCAEFLIEQGRTSGSIQNATSQIIKVCNGTLAHYLGLHYRYA